MSSQHLITIVTIVFNDKRGLERTLESVRPQKTSDIEWLIIDGLSTDGSHEVSNNNLDVVDQVVYEPDDGIFDAMNKGIGLASGRYILFLNAGDEILPGGIQTLLKSGKTGSDIICHAITVVNKNNSESIYVPESPLKKFDPQRMYWPHPGMLVKRAVYEKIKFFDLKYRFSSDLDWANRVIISGDYSVTLLDSVISRFYTGGVSSSLASFKESRDISIKYGKPILMAYVRYIKTLVASKCT